MTAAGRRSIVATTMSAAADASPAESSTTMSSTSAQQAFGKVCLVPRRHLGVDRLRLRKGENQRVGGEGANAVASCARPCSLRGEGLVLPKRLDQAAYLARKCRYCHGFN